jgi:thiamine-monophosphate kinase
MMMFFLIKKKELVISVDTYNEGIHFPNFNKPYLVIKKNFKSNNI